MLPLCFNCYVRCRTIMFFPNNANSVDIKHFYDSFLGSGFFQQLSFLYSQFRPSLHSLQNCLSLYKSTWSSVISVSSISVDYHPLYMSKPGQSLLNLLFMSFQLIYLYFSSSNISSLHFAQLLLVNSDFFYSSSIQSITWKVQIA